MIETSKLFPEISNLNYYRIKKTKATDYLHNIDILFPLLKIYISSRYKTEITTTNILEVLIVLRERPFQQVWKLTPLIYS